MDILRRDVTEEEFYQENPAEQTRWTWPNYLGMFFIITIIALSYGCSQASSNGSSAAGDRDDTTYRDDSNDNANDNDNATDNDGANDNATDNNDANDDDATDNANNDNGANDNNGNTDDTNSGYDTDQDGIVDSIDIDYDGNGLIDIFSAADLGAIRTQIAGNSYANNQIYYQQNCGSRLDFVGCQGYELMADISLSGNANWEPIGYCTNADSVPGGAAGVFTCPEYFSGVFEGNGHSITGLSINTALNSAHTYGVGLFGAVSGKSSFLNLNIIDATIEVEQRFVGALIGVVSDANNPDITIENVTISSSTFASTFRVGALAGYLIDTSVEAVRVFDNVLKISSAGGGMIGEASNTAIINSVSDNNHISTVATLVSKSGAGGLLGSATEVVIIGTRSTNNQIQGDNSVGGLVGNSLDGLQIINTHIYQNNVSGEQYVGGIAGSMERGVIDSSTSTLNNISSENIDAGGMLGTMDNSQLLRSQSSMNSIYGNAEVGGLVGYAEGSYISNSTSRYDDVSGATDIGGLVGISYISTINTSASIGGVITGSSLVGGLVGDIEEGAIIKSVASNNSIVATTSIAGGLAGSAQDAMIKSSLAQSNLIQGTEQVGGLIGSSERSVITLSASHAAFISGENMLGGAVGNSQETSISDTSIIVDLMQLVDSSTTEVYMGGFFGNIQSGTTSVAQSFTAIKNLDVAVPSLTMPGARVAYYDGIAGNFLGRPLLANTYWLNDFVISNPGLLTLTDIFIGEGKSELDLQTPITPIGIYSYWGAITCNGEPSGPAAWDFSGTDSYPRMICPGL